MYETKKDIEASGIVSTIVGHVGDGMFFDTDVEDGLSYNVSLRQFPRTSTLQD